MRGRVYKVKNFRTTQIVVGDGNIFMGVNEDSHIGV